MRKVFADTGYWLAISLRNDSWNKVAEYAMKKIGEVQLITTDEVLTEYLTSISKCNPAFRLAAVKTVQSILDNPNIIVIPQSRQSFKDGLIRYAARADKQYSLQDCISMNVMETDSITDVLTNDHHFEQEGFTILMRKS